MSMERYENFRENGWKSYEDGANVISFFVKRESNQPAISGIEFKPPETHFKHVFSVSGAITLLEYKMRYKRNYKAWEVDVYSGLWNYLEQCRDGDYKKCLLSGKELNILLDSKARKLENERKREMKRR